MTASHEDLMRLAACAAQTYHAHQRMAYAQLSPDLMIEQISANFAAMALAAPQPEVEVVNRPLSDVLWEFVGADAALHAVAHDDVLAVDRVGEAAQRVARRRMGGILERRGGNAGVKTAHSVSLANWPPSTPYCNPTIDSKYTVHSSLTPRTPEEYVLEHGDHPFDAPASRNSLP